MVVSLFYIIIDILSTMIFSKGGRQAGIRGSGAVVVVVVVVVGGVGILLEEGKARKNRAVGRI